MKSCGLRSRRAKSFRPCTDAAEQKPRRLNLITTPLYLAPTGDEAGLFFLEPMALPPEI